MQIGTITDKQKKNYWNLATGEFSLSSNSFNVDGESADDFFKGSLSQDDIFNKLTNNGQVKGIYLQSGRLYINADYIQAGTIKDKAGKSWWNLTTGEFHTENGTFTGNITGSTIIGSEIRFQNTNGATAYLGSEGIGISDQEENRIRLFFDGSGSNKPSLSLSNADNSKRISINFINGILVKDGDNHVSISPFGTIGGWKDFINILSNGRVYNPVFTGADLTIDVEYNVMGTSYLTVEDSIFGKYRVALEKV